MGIRERILELEAEAISPRFVILNDNYKADLNAMSIDDYEDIEDLLNEELSLPDLSLVLSDTGLIACFTSSPKIDIVVI